MPEGLSRHRVRARIPLRAWLLVLIVSWLGSAARAQNSTAAGVLIPRPSGHLAPHGAGATTTTAGSHAVGSAGWWLGSTGIALLLAVCGTVCALARRYRPQDSVALVRVVGRVSLSPRHSIFMVKAGRRVLLIGTGSQGAPSLLGELALEDQTEGATDPDRLGDEP
jgi:hypothetical protein